MLSPMQAFRIHPGAQGGTSLEGLKGRLHSWSDPSHLPGPRRYLHGCNLSGGNFPASLRPAPRDATGALAPAGQSAAGSSASAPPPPAPRRSAPQHGVPARALGRRAGGLVTCLRRSRSRSDQFLSASAWPAPIDRSSVSAQTEDKENARCSSGGEESFPNRGGIKKSPPQLSSSSNRLSKNISSTRKKTAHATLDDDQPCEFFKKGSRVNESHQKSSSMDAGPSGSKPQHSKNSSGKRQSKSQVSCVPSRPKSSLVGVPQPAREELGRSRSPEGKAQRSPLGPGCQGASGNKLFLEFRSMRLMREDADEDSASDLSDSERVPLPPAPRTPPDLRLRAEEIDPVCFDLDLHPVQSHRSPEYCYPNFLPPPCDSWDLRDMAVLVNVEHRPGAVPRTGGLLGRYIDRLVQLEWLQLQTVQGERGKGAKARPPTTPGTTGPLKNPGRSKLMAGAVSRPHQDGTPKSAPSRKKGFHHGEGHLSCRPFETSPQPVAMLGSSRWGSQKQTLDLRAEEKKKCSKSPRPPRQGPASSDSSLQMESIGNVRIPKQSAVILDPMDSHKASKTQAHPNLKKKGNTHSCGHTSSSSEKKPKTNGGKQNARKFQ